MADTPTGGGASKNNPKKSTAGSTSGKAVSRNAGNATGGGGLANINNPPTNKTLHGGHPSKGGFGGKHVKPANTRPAGR